MPAETFKNLTDEDLLNLIAEGNRQAFNMFISNNIKKATTFCYGSLNYPTKDVCEDLTQNLFLKIWINAKKYNSKKAKASTWFYTILRNECINYNKQNKNFYELNEDFHETKNGFENDALKKQLRKFVHNLPEKQKTAIILFYFQGHSQKECAGIMKLKEKAFESTLIRAKKNLQNSIKLKEALQ